MCLRGWNQSRRLCFRSSPRKTSAAGGNAVILRIVPTGTLLLLSRGYQHPPASEPSRFPAAAKYTSLSGRLTCRDLTPIQTYLDPVMSVTCETTQVPTMGLIQTKWLGLPTDTPIVVSAVPRLEAILRLAGFLRPQGSPALLGSLGDSFSRLRR